MGDLVELTQAVVQGQRKGLLWGVFVVLGARFSFGLIPDGVVATIRVVLLAPEVEAVPHHCPV